MHRIVGGRSPDEPRVSGISHHLFSAAGPRLWIHRLNITSDVHHCQKIDATAKDEQDARAWDSVPVDRDVRQLGRARADSPEAKNRPDVLTGS